MITTKELRAGNILAGNPLAIPKAAIYSDGWLEITAYGIWMVDEGNLPIEGIPLTKEVLLRCGFRYDENTKEYNNGFLFVTLWENGKHLESRSRVWLSYLHQLQNLYFSLTWKELEIK